MTPWETGFSLGSNLGDRMASLRAARDRIVALPDVKLLAQSPVYETEPVGVRPEYASMKFLNAVLVVESARDAHEWYEATREIENELGRERTMDRFAPRAIDIDIVYVGDLRVESGGLAVPHKHWHERRFVAQPLADVRPNLRLPGCSKTVAEVLEGLKDAEGVALYREDWR